MTEFQLLVEIGFHEGAHQRQQAAHHVEDEHWLRFEEGIVEECRHRMDQNVSIRSERVLRTVFPRLHAITVD